MAKQDVLDAINATIVENGQKGITAQALNNVLTMMTENAGEGSGSGNGVLRIMAPDGIFLAPASFGSEAIGDGFTPETWTLVQSGLESIISSGDLSDEEKESYETYLTSMNEIVPTMFAHNAKVYTELLAKAKSKEGVMLLIDQSASIVPAFELLTTNTLLKDVDISLSTPAIGAIINFNDLSDSSVEIIPIGDQATSSDSDYVYTNASRFNLNPDGSIVAIHIVRNFIYVPSPTNSEGVLTDGQKAHNSVFYNALTNLENVEYVAFVNSSGSSLISSCPKIILKGNNNVRYFEGIELKQATLAEDGSVTVTTLGTLTSEGSGSTSGGGTLRIVITTSEDGSTLTPEEYLTENVETYNKLSSGEAWDAVLYVLYEGGFAIYHPTSTSFDEGSITFTASLGENTITSTLSSDGSAELIIV